MHLSKEEYQTEQSKTIRCMAKLGRYQVKLAQLLAERNYVRALEIVEGVDPETDEHKRETPGINGLMYQTAVALDKLIASDAEKAAEEGK